MNKSKKKVSLITAVPFMVIVDQNSNFIIQKRINKNIQQEMKYIIETKDLDVINKSNYSWL